MIIDIVYDFLCPWCFVGKRHLDLAIARVQPRGLTLRWHQFMLYPDFDRGGHDFLAFFKSRYGESLRVPMWDSIRAVAAPVGINFAFERMTRGPAALDGHRLVRLAARDMPGSEAALIEHISSSFFEQARIIDDAFLIDAGVQAGLKPQRVIDLLASDDDIDALFAETSDWRARGITAMPTYLIDGQRLMLAHTSVAAFEAVLRG
jgi:predicted DsbA family dithiol-disulfide isomerase